MHGTMRAGTGTLRTLDRTGDTEVTWDPGNAAEVRTARETFDAMVGRGYRAFRADGGKRGARMDTFDPQAGEIVLVPQMAGG